MPARRFAWRSAGSVRNHASVSALVAAYSIREAGKPADREHPYGHGKIETLSSLLDSVLLVVASVIIVSEAVSHFRHPTPVEHTDVAIATMEGGGKFSVVPKRHIE